MREDIILAPPLVLQNCTFKNSNQIMKEHERFCS